MQTREPGWYPDPLDRAVERWHEGDRWGTKTRPKQSNKSSEPAAPQDSIPAATSEFVDTEDSGTLTYEPQTTVPMPAPAPLPLTGMPPPMPYQRAEQPDSRSAIAAAGERSRGTFVNSLVEGMRRYATFSGRSSRAYYWRFVTFYWFASFVISNRNGLALVLFLPAISYTVRRLHDTGRSGWYLLLPIVNIVMLCQTGDPNPNRYGAPPLGSPTVPDTQP